MQRRRLTLLELKKLLQEKLPTKKPVRIRRTRTDVDTSLIPWESDFGETEDMGDHFLIRINKEHPERIQKDTLMHEWAHCMADWSTRGHTNHWGVAYARVYREIMGAE